MALYAQSGATLETSGYSVHQSEITNSMEQELLEKLVSPQIFKKFPAFYRTRKFDIPPPAPILSQIHPIHGFLSYLSKVFF
jgi:hypothetical protein